VDNQNASGELGNPVAPNTFPHGLLIARVPVADEFIDIVEQRDGDKFRYVNFVERDGEYLPFVFNDEVEWEPIAEYDMEATRVSALFELLQMIYETEVEFALAQAVTSVTGAQMAQNAPKPKYTN